MQIVGWRSDHKREKATLESHKGTVLRYMFQPPRPKAKQRENPQVDLVVRGCRADSKLKAATSPLLTAWTQQLSPNTVVKHRICWSSKHLGQHLREDPESPVGSYFECKDRLVLYSPGRACPTGA
jgi:hypothetical protein